MELKEKAGGNEGKVGRASADRHAATCQQWIV